MYSFSLLSKSSKANLYEVEVLYRFACTWYFISHEKNELKNEFCTKNILKCWCLNSCCLSVCYCFCLGICSVIRWSSNSTPRHVTQENWKHVKMNTCTALLKMAKKWKQPKYPSIDEWLNNIWYIHIVLFSHKKEWSTNVCYTC